MLQYLFRAAKAPLEFERTADGLITGYLTNSTFSSKKSDRKNPKHQHCYMHRQMPK